jgi:hypothetical protein
MFAHEKMSVRPGKTMSECSKTSSDNWYVRSSEYIFGHFSLTD